MGMQRRGKAPAAAPLIAEDNLDLVSRVEATVLHLHLRHEGVAMLAAIQPAPVRLDVLIGRTANHRAGQLNSRLGAAGSHVVVGGRVRALRAVRRVPVPHVPGFGQLDAHRRSRRQSRRADLIADDPRTPLPSHPGRRRDVDLTQLPIPRHALRSSRRSGVESRL